MANLIGQKLGNYEITGFLGEGGMASVYRARQTAINRDVAIKVIKAGLGDTAEFMKRFAREAQTVAALNHPHILKVFDYGQQDNLVYLVMELQPGGSLSGLIEAGRMPTDRISAILEQIASALDYAHRQGIVHRDLKPQNILLDPNGNAILTDFGVAKLLNENTAALTQSGAAIGTPTYMAPEQWQGLPVDGRTDIYALGVVLFQMVSGQLPFKGDTPFSVMNKHIYDTPPSLVSDRPQLSPAVDFVVRRAMAKDPDDRFSTAAEMAQAFKDALTPLSRTKPVMDISAPATALYAPASSIATDPPGPIARTQTTTSPAAPARNPLLLGVIGLVAVAVIVVVVGAVIVASHTTATPTTVPTATAQSIAAAAISPSPLPPTASTVPPAIKASNTAVPVTAVPNTSIPTITALNTAIPTTMPSNTAIPPTLVPNTATPIAVVPTRIETVNLAATNNVQTLAAGQTLAVAISNAQAQFTATAAQAIVLAATGSPTPTISATLTPTIVIPTIVPTTAIPTNTATVPPTTTIASNGVVAFANQASGAFLDSLTISLINVPLAGEGRQYVAWLSDRAKPPLRLGKLQVRADGTAQLAYADPKGSNLLASYNVVFITIQTGVTATPQDPIAFSGALPPLAGVHVQHVLTQFPDTPGTIGLMIGALQQANILTDHANLLGTALKQNDVALTKAHMEHIYNILTGKDGAKDINGDGTLTISPPGDGYGLFNYLANAVEHATLAVEQPDATDAMKVAAKRLATAITNITAVYTKIQGLIDQAASKKSMAEIKPLMAQLVALNTIAMNGTSGGTATPDVDSAQFDGLLNAFTQAAKLGTINVYPGDAALRALSSSATLQTSGTMVFANHSKTTFLDSLTITLSHIPLPVGNQRYVAWLTDRVNASLNLGTLLVNPDGTAQLTYVDPAGANLLAKYSAVFVTRQSGNTATAQDLTITSGALPPLAGVHVQHVLTQFPDTPGTIGLMIGALQQANILTDHANLLVTALKQNDVALTKAHMEHIYNILTGKDGAKDINGDGTLTISPPGDGYGLFNYLANAVEHATLAVEQPDATDAMKVAAKRLATAITNITAVYTKIQGLIDQAASKKSMAEIKPLMTQLVALNTIAMNGTSGGTATPDVDSAQFDGLLNAFTQAANLGTIALSPGNAALKISATTGSTPVATVNDPASTPIPTMAGMSMGGSSDVTPTALPISPDKTPTSIPANTVVIQMQGQTFVQANVTVKVGTMVVFSNQSLELHTATADNGFFATGALQPGTESKPILMSKPGTYVYYCEFHGGPGHVGMSGVITVQ